MSTLAVSSAITTLPAVSIAASGVPERALACVYAATSSAPLFRARRLSVHWVLVTAFASQPPAAAGSGLRQQEMFRTAIGSLVTTSRTAMPAQTQLWNAWHQCSAPLISTGPCASSAVPMPFVPAAHSDQQNQGARLASAALASVAWSPHSARIRPVASVTVTTPPRLAHVVRHGGGAETQLGEHDIVFGRVVDLRDGHRGLGEVRVDPVLLPAAMPGDRHFGPDARDVILALHEPFPRREHGAPAGAADMGSSRCTSLIVENRLWSPHPTSSARPHRSPLVAAGPPADWAQRRASSCIVTRVLSRRPALSTLGMLAGLRHAPLAACVGGYGVSPASMWRATWAANRSASTIV